MLTKQTQKLLSLSTFVLGVTVAMFGVLFPSIHHYCFLTAAFLVGGGICSSFTFVFKSKMSQYHEYVLGLPLTNIPGNSSHTFLVKPQVSFRPERLIVPGYLEKDFVINDIKVGNVSQIHGPSSLPAVVFTETAFGVRLKMDTAHTTTDVTVVVTNQNSEAINFTGVLVGQVVE